MGYFKRIIPDRSGKGRSLWWTFAMMLIVMFFIIYLNTIALN